MAQSARVLQLMAIRQPTRKRTSDDDQSAADYPHADNCRDPGHCQPLHTAEATIGNGQQSSDLGAAQGLAASSIEHLSTSHPGSMPNASCGRARARALGIRSALIRSLPYRPKKARPCIDEAVTAVETTKERWCEADVHRTALGTLFRAPSSMEHLFRPPRRLLHRVARLLLRNFRTRYGSTTTRAARASASALGRSLSRP
jgi:hypothetical protein